MRVQTQRDVWKLIRMAEKKIIRNSRGGAAVEFALILPLLLMLIFGAIELGLLLYNKQILTNATREGARVGVLVREPPRSLDGENLEIIQTVRNYGAKNLINFRDAQFSDPVITTYDNTARKEIARTADHLGFNSRYQLKVTTTYIHEFLILPDLMKIISGGKVVPGQLTIRAESIMAME
jgi:Flp pilus assembly protein TadG